MLTVAGLDVFYGRAQVLFGIAFEAHAGEVVVLVGRNGAGKSTTLKAVMGLVPVADGEIVFEGRSLRGLDSHEIARLGLGYVPEDRRIFTGLTVAENLEVGRQPPRPGAPVWTLDRVFALFPNLADMRERPAGRMSGGEQQMLTIARTLMGNPRAILLDEPSEGLAPVIVAGMAETVKTLKRAGVSVVLCEQNLRFAARVAERAYVIEKGRIVHSGPMAALAADEALRRAYLMV